MSSLDVGVAGGFAGTNGGGSLREPAITLLFATNRAVLDDCDDNDDTDWNESVRMLGIRGTSTQSGSLLGVQGLEGLPGFGMLVFVGGLMVDLANCPPSNHHFFLSLLAAGSPGSIGS